MVAMETHIHKLFVKNSFIHQLADICFNYPTLGVHKKSDVILSTILAYFLTTKEEHMYLQNMTNRVKTKLPIYSVSAKFPIYSAPVLNCLTKTFKRPIVCLNIYIFVSREFQTYRYFA